MQFILSFLKGSTQFLDDIMGPRDETRTFCDSRLFECFKLTVFHITNIIYYINLSRSSDVTAHYPVFFYKEEGWRAAGGEGEGPASKWQPTSQPRNLAGADEEAQGRVEGSSARRRFGSTFSAGKRWKRFDEL